MLVKINKNNYSIAESLRSSSTSLGINEEELTWNPAICDVCGKLTGAGPLNFCQI